ncbi:hypothetical protein CUN85_06470 [Methanolobus halotolerans]|uniref:Uncharacterized protein n=1 Tax=Methanolobus halotolerans TaxID=2052935 RepID=A0A4E0QZW9_9EURY|nr:hypothetical protein CUN85_06470 [Methanolobus halotolerans]
MEHENKTGPCRNPQNSSDYLSQYKFYMSFRIVFIFAGLWIQIVIPRGFLQSLFFFKCQRELLQVCKMQKKKA